MASSTKAGNRGWWTAFRIATGAGVGTVLALAAFASLRAGTFARETRAEVVRPGVAFDAMADGTIEVPSEASSLQAAIDFAPDGAAIQLDSGTYVGRVSVRGKSLTVRGAGAGSTIIRGFGDGPVLALAGDGSQRVEVSGIAFVGGQGASGAGLLVDRVGFAVRDSHFAGNQGSGAVVHGATGSFTGCTFEGNRSPGSGGAVRNDSGAVTFVSCAFGGNVSATFGGAVCSVRGTVAAHGCTFTDNATGSGAWGGAVYGDRAAIELDGSQFVRNRSIESGGAVYLTGGSADVVRCTFSGNQSDEAKSIFSRGAGTRIAATRLCGAREVSLGGDVSFGDGNVFDGACFGDCNQNGISDAEEIAAGWATDRDGNGIPDTCDPDCNSNGLPDGYEITAGFAQDANHNGMIDFCEIRSGLAVDADGDWIPDDAQPASASAQAAAAVDSVPDALATEAVVAPAVTAGERASWGPGVRKPRGMRGR